MPFKLSPARHLANSYISDLAFPPEALCWQPGLGQATLCRCVGTGSPALAEREYSTEADAPFLPVLSIAHDNSVLSNNWSG